MGLQSLFIHLTNLSGGGERSLPSFRLCKRMNHRMVLASLAGLGTGAGHVGRWSRAWTPGPSRLAPRYGLMGRARRALSRRSAASGRGWPRVEAAAPCPNKMHIC